MNQVMFIEGKDLGILEATLRGITHRNTKRQRKAEVMRTARVLRDLRMIGPEHAVTGVAYGARSDGTVGLFVTFDTATRVEGPIPGESP